MSKMMKRLSATLMACTLLATGCSSGGNGGKEVVPTTEPTASATATASATETAGEDVPGWQQHKDDKVKLSWYLNFSWYPNQWGVDATSKAITEATGVDVEFIVPAGSEAEKLNTMIASDTLPDIITLGWWEGQINEMIDGDMLYALNELADQYDPYFYKVADSARLGWYTKDDGNVYGYPNSSYSPADYEKYDIPSNTTFVVRKDIYEAIGSPDMSTPEGFVAALEKAKQQFPQVNGQPLIPLGMKEFTSTGNTSLQRDLQDFLAVSYEKDGKFNDRMSDPEYVKWLKTIRSLTDKGLLAEDIFVDKRAQMEEKIAQGRYFAMMFDRTDFAAQQKQLFEQDPNSIYMAIDGPKNSNGDPHTLTAAGIEGWTVTLISKNCKRPDRAIELFSYLISEEGQKMTWLGPEGVTYDVVNSKPVVKEEVKAVLSSDRTKYDQTYGGDSTFWMFQDNAMALQWLEPTQEPLAQMEQWTYPYAFCASAYGDVNPAVGTEEEIIKIKTDALVGETLPKLLLAKSDAEFDEIYNKFIADRDALGFQKLMDYSTVRMQENKAKLGAE